MDQLMKQAVDFLVVPCYLPLYLCIYPQRMQ
jgi:hypothetical protein